MKEKIYQVCEEMLANEEEAKKFASYETLEELYEYFLSKLPELTKDEFEEFVCEALDSYAKQKESVDKIDNDVLGEVSGGAFNLRTKITSGVLAFLAAASVVPGMKAANVNDAVTSESISQTKSVKTKISDTFGRVKAWVKAHPGLTAGIGLGTLILGGIAIALGVRHSRKAKESKVGGYVKTNNMQGSGQKIVQSTGSKDNEAPDKDGDTEEPAVVSSMEEKKHDDLGGAAAGADVDRTQAEEEAKKKIEEERKKAEEEEAKKKQAGEKKKNVNYKKLLKAIRNKNLDEVKSLWEEDPGLLEKKNDKGYTTLHLAAMEGNVDCVKFLLEKSPGLIETISSQGNTVLHAAAYGGNQDIIKFLLGKVTNEQKKMADENGRNVLHYAVRGGKVPSALILMKEVPELIEQKDVDGNTPFDCATTWDAKKVLQKKYNDEYGRDEGDESRNNILSSALEDKKIGERLPNVRRATRRVRRPTKNLRENQNLLVQQDKSDDDASS